MRRFLTPGTVALAVLSVVAIVLLVLAVQKQNALSSTPARAAPAAASPSVPPSAPTPVAFLGDGYTSGSPDGGLGPSNYTALLAGRDGWRVTNAAVYGSGYVAGVVPLTAQVQKAVDARPQLVVVSAGRADSDGDPASVREAATRLYRDLDTRLPGTRVVVVGPMWIGGDAPQEMLAVRDAIRDAARTANLPFVDPIADRWFDGRDVDGVTPSGENLTDRGHQRLADLVGEAVRRTGAVPG